MNAKKKILLVDDHHDILDLLELFLYRDYEIVTAANGFEGLKKAREEAPQCIITDIMMPVMDGIKFFNSLKKQEGTATIPVIGITSFVKKITIKSLLNLGFFGVITKPLDRDALLSTVIKALAPRQAPGSPNAS
jgi:CheY-like chemotaxis protein